MTSEKTPSRETILVVEDESILRTMLREVLQYAGYRVLEAANGESALAAVGAGKMPDLVLTDLVMPKMNGSQLAQHLLRLYPDLKIIFMSGYTNDEEVVKDIVAAKVEFLQKPFAPSLLLQKLREILPTAPQEKAGASD